MCGNLHRISWQASVASCSGDSYLHRCGEFPAAPEACMWRDLRYAVAGLRRRPVFTVAAPGVDLPHDPAAAARAVVVSRVRDTPRRDAGGRRWITGHASMTPVEATGHGEFGTPDGGSRLPSGTPDRSGVSCAQLPSRRLDRDGSTSGGRRRPSCRCRRSGWLGADVTASDSTRTSTRRASTLAGSACTSSCPRRSAGTGAIEPGIRSRDSESVSACPAPSEVTRTPGRSSNACGTLRAHVLYIDITRSYYA